MTYWQVLREELKCYGVMLGIIAGSGVVLYLLGEAPLHITLIGLVGVGIVWTVIGSKTQIAHYKREYFRFIEGISPSDGFALATDRTWFPKIMKVFGGPIETNDRILMGVSTGPISGVSAFWQGPPLKDDSPYTIGTRTYYVFKGYFKFRTFPICPRMIRFGMAPKEDISQLIYELQRRINE